MSGLDISKLAERLAELNSGGNRGGGSNMSFLNLKDGRNVLRVLPPKDGAESFYEEVFVHWGVGKSEDNKRGKMVVCPTTKGDDQPCPVCELVAELRKLSKKKDDSYDKQARSIARKKRVYYNAISRDEDISKYEKKDGKWYNADGEEESPVKVWSTGIGIFKDILGLIIDPEYGDITDAEEGLDLIVTKTGTGFNTNYDVKTVRKESVIGFDDWEECINDLSALAKPKSYADIESIMNGEDPSASSNDDEDDSEDEEDNTNTEDTNTDTDSGTEESGDEDGLQDEIKAALARRKSGK